MIEQIYTYFTIETLYMWVNLGVLPFWFILIFFPISIQTPSTPGAPIGSNNEGESTQEVYVTTGQESYPYSVDCV